MVTRVGLRFGDDDGHVEKAGLHRIAAYGSALATAVEDEVVDRSRTDLLHLLLQFVEVRW
jgi:hypothetical protein